MTDTATGPVAGSPAPARARFGDALRVREFRVIYAADVVSMLGTSLSIVVLAVLVFQHSGSPLLSALTFTLGFTPYLLGGWVASRVADRLPARGVMVGCDLLRAALFATMAVPGVPLGILLALVGVAAAVTPLFTGAAGRLLPQVLGEGPTFVVGRSLLRVTSQVQQVVAVALSAALLLVIPPRELLLVNAASFVISSAVLRLGLRAYAVAAAADGPPLTGLRPVLADPARRRLLLLGWLVPAFGVAPEALATPYVVQLGLPATRAGLLLWTVPLGVAVSELLLVRLVPSAWWTRLMLPLAALTLTAPIALLARPSLPLAGLVLATAGAGFAYSLGFDALLIAATPENLRGRTYAVFSAGMMFTQGLGFAGAGAVGEFLPANQAAPLVVGVGLLALLLLVGRGRTAQFQRAKSV